jgi:hypothetical protein
VKNVEIKNVHPEAVAMSKKNKRPRKRQHTSTSNEKAKREKLPFISQSNDSQVDINIISSQVRKSVADWKDRQNDERLKNLSEACHYSLSISHSPNNSSSYMVSIKCTSCDTSITLQQKDKSAPYL